MVKKIGENQEIIELLKRAVEHVSNGVVISDPNKPDNPLIYVNDSFLKITGYTRQEIIGKNCRFLQGKDTKQEELKKIRNALKNKKEIYVVLKNYKKNGEMFWNELYITPVFNEKKELTHFIGIQNDITLRKKAEEEVQKYKAYLEKTVDERTKDLIQANEQLKKEAYERQKAQEKISELYNRISESAKKLEVKLKKVDYERIPLTQKEKKAFYYTIRYPEKTLKELSTLSGLSTSTINAVKLRLYKEGYYEKQNLPNPYIAQNYLLSITYYDGILTNETPKDKTEKEFSTTPEIIYSKKTDKTGFYIIITKNWNEFKNIQDKIQKETGINHSNYKTLNTVHFSINNSNILRYFDYSDLIQKRLELEQEPIKILKLKKINQQFSESEKKVFYGLIKHPEFNLSKLSKRIEVSEPTISKNKNKYINQRQIKIIIKPTYKKIGTHLLVLNHAHFQAEDTEYEETNPNTYLSIITTTDYVSLSLYKDYAEMKEQQELNAINRKRKTIGEPNNIIIPLENINHTKQDFSEFLKKVLFEK